YVLIHSLNRPRFTVCPGQTWNVPPILNENLISCQIPDWHRGKRANPVCGVPLTLKMVVTHILVLLREFLAETTPLESSLKSMYGEAILPPEKSTSETLITVPIRFH
ncbi:hypothetical protein, partial [Salmonella enterica]|uniref:hypothetical protein n=1 Tax=Salmonella enterica TaxID=28901 RepID=UPI0021B35966